MTAIILTSLIAYAVVVAGLGFWANTQSKDTAEDYFIHSRSLSWTHLSVTFLATWFSTIAFVAFPGKVIEGGIAVYLALGGFNIMSSLFVWIIGRKLWRLGHTQGYITPGDLLGHYYNSRFIRLMTGLIAAIGLFPYILVQLVAIGKVIDVATQGFVTYDMAVLMSALIATFYVITGGIRAVVWTDIIQLLLFFAVAVFGLYAVLSVVGDVGEGFRIAMEKRPDLFTFDREQFGKPVTLMIIWSFGGILLPHLWQRAYMAESAETLSKTVVMHSGFTFVYNVIGMMVALLAISFFADLPDKDKFIPTLYGEIIPWALPVLVLATFAAGMSTVDSQLLTLSSVLIRDVFKVIAPGVDLTPAQERMAGRGVILVAIALLVFIALTPEGQAPIYTVASKGIGLAFMLLVPVIGPLFWARAGGLAAASALVIGVVVQMALEFGFIEWQIPYGFGAPIVAFVAQVPVFVGLSYLRPRAV